MMMIDYHTIRCDSDRDNYGAYNIRMTIMTMKTVELMENWHSKKDKK
jgi:hypothetical protein